MRFEQLGVGVLRVDNIIGAGAPVEMGIGEKYYVDGVNGSNGNSGKTPGTALSTPAAGYSALTASQNDRLLLMPSTYTLTETLTWAKAQTHMIGIGNPTWRQGGKIRLQTTVEAATATVDVTASGVFFGGFNITQNGAFTACVTALRLSSTYFSAEQLDLRGHLQATVAATEAASSLEFAAAGNGFASTFMDCNIGTGSGSARSCASAEDGNGVINFAGTASGPGYVEFHDCRILSRSSTVYPVMVRAVVPNSFDRYVLFKDSLFHNFYLHQTDKLDAAFRLKQAAGGSSYFMLKNCMAGGIDQWQIQDQAQPTVLSDMPIVGTGGGLGLQPTGAAGA